MMLHNHFELTQGEKGDTCVRNDRCETECTGRKVTRKHGDLQEIAYETFGLASPRDEEARQLSHAGYKQSQWLDGSLGAHGVRSDD